MIKPAYTLPIPTAIFLVLLILSGCAEKQQQATIHIDPQRIQRAEAALLAKQIASDTNNIEQLVSQARLEHPLAFSRHQLLKMTQDQTLPQESRGLAALKYAELLLILHTADAFKVSQASLEIWAQHPYAPYVQLELAKAWLALDANEEALHLLIAATQHEEMEAGLIEALKREAEPVLEMVDEQQAIAWMLAIAVPDVQHRDAWLYRAARLATLDFVLTLRQSDIPLGDAQAKFYQYVARERLMVGDYHAVRVISKILQHDMPTTSANTVVLKWAESEGQQNVVGVLLPLSGKYAAYGKQVLRGIRLAMSRPEFEGSITLRVQDSAGDEQVCISGYFQLLTDGAQWVIGPLLSKNTAALAAYLVDDVPVISLSNQTKLAAESPSLFIHSLAKTVQADFMAHYAWKQGKRRMLIIYGSKASEQDEALAFAQTFMDEGGDIVDMMPLEKGISDYRPALVKLRERTDNEMLLASLEEDLFLFGAEQNVDIKLPVNVDAMYIATSGKQLAVLAGQMAYLDLQRTQFYGSYHWFDGHLLDDDGRYLSASEFATPLTNVIHPGQPVLDIQSQYRVIWNEETVSPLFYLAYDAAMNVASLGSRLGLKGEDALSALHHAAGFPAISGDYYFDAYGLSQKTFAIQRVKRGRIEEVVVQP